MIDKLTEWLLQILDKIQIPVGTEEFLEGNEREEGYLLPEEDLEVHD